MTTLLERSFTTDTSGDEAIEIIDTYRGWAEDYTRVEALDVEFPYYAAHLGTRGVSLAVLSDNVCGAFKWRGALVKAMKLKEQGVDNVVSPSAGNHARGSVLAAKALDMSITVAVPTSAPYVKREGIRDLWDSSSLTLRVVGKTFDDSLAWAIAQEAAMLHPFDDHDVMTGQGTVVDDMLRMHPDTQHLVMPIGGGGLAGGVAKRLIELGRDDISLHLAEAHGSNSPSRSLENGRATAIGQPNPRYGGAAVKCIGQLAYQHLRRYPRTFTLDVPDVDVDEVTGLYIDGRRDLLRDDTPNLEPTSLLAVAALKQLRHLKGETVVLGTGQNDSLYPLATPTSYHVPF